MSKRTTPAHGVDPDVLFSSSSQRRGNDHKLYQLCAQAERAVSLVLAEAGDELSSLYVLAVEPAPNAARLCVVVAPVVWTAAMQPADLHAHLEASKGWLRSQVAAAIHRKRTPNLVFSVVMSPEVDDDDDA